MAAQRRRRRRRWRQDGSGIIKQHSFGGDLGRRMSAAAIKLAKATDRRTESAPCSCSYRNLSSSCEACYRQTAASTTTSQINRAYQQPRAFTSCSTKRFSDKQRCRHALCRHLCGRPPSCAQRLVCSGPARDPPTARKHRHVYARYELFSEGLGLKSDDFDF